MEYLDIDNIINNAAQEQHVDAPTQSWADIHSALHQKKTKKWTLLWLLPLIATAFAGGYWLGNNAQQKTICGLPATTQQAHIKNNISNNDLAQVNNIKAINKQNTIDEKSALILSKQSITGNTSNVSLTQLQPISTNKPNPYQPVNIKEIAVVELENEVAQVRNNESNLTEATLPKDTITTNQSSKESIELVEKQNVPETTIIKRENVTFIDSTFKTKLPAEISAVKKTKSIWEKWNFEVSAMTSLLTISNTSIFNLSESKKSLNTQSFGPSNAAALKPRLNALNATMQQLNIVANKNYKKIALQLGVQLQYGSYNIIGYGAGAISNNALANNLIFLDLTGQSNFFGATAAVLPVPYRIGSSPVYLKNQFFNAGVLLGINKPIIYYNKKPRITAGLQLVPSYTVAQNVYWLNENNSRLWKSNDDNRKFNLFSNMSLDYLCRIGKLKTSIGPVYSFSAWGLNKKNSTISNVNVNAIGIKLGLKR